MKIADIIEKRMTETFAPTQLDVVDESALHAGHAGARPEGESHFRLLVVSDQFKTLSRIERQRLIYKSLGDLMVSDIHALSIKALTPDEIAQQA